MTGVVDVLRDIETKNSVRVLFAVEAGSRVFGTGSESSDYDVRFVFVHNDQRKYLSLSEPKEDISGFSDDRQYDWQGWDIRKALKLLRQQNPSVIEWLHSPIVYMNKIEPVDLFHEGLSLVQANPRRTPLVYHYASMARSNFAKHAQGQTEVSVKKYLNVVRPAMMVEWIFLRARRKEVEADAPLLSLDISTVLSDLTGHLDPALLARLESMVERKKAGQGADMIPRDELIDNWVSEIVGPSLRERIAAELAETQTTPPVEDYDDIFYRIVTALR